MFSIFKIIKDSKYNIIMLLSFLMILIFNVISLLLTNVYLSNQTAYLANAIFGVATVIGLIVTLIKKDNNSQDYNTANKNKYFVGLIGSDEIEENKSMLLMREEHRNDIIKEIQELFELPNKAKGLILTGESGAGKSTLIHFLCHDLIKEGYNVKVCDSYSDGGNFPKPDRNKKNVFIFDQFERSLNFGTLERWIESYNYQFDNCVFLFSFPQRFLTGICSKIRQNYKDFYLKSYVLYLNESDTRDYLTKIKAITGLEDIEVEKMWIEKNFVENRIHRDDNSTALACLLERELYKVKKGTSPLIEMEFLGSMIEQFIGSEAEITDTNFIEYYFDRWVGQFDKQETAYAILNLFSQFEEYSLTDIKLLTFEEKNKFDRTKNGKIFSFLKNCSFLSNKNGTKGQTEKADCFFKPQHEYVSRAIQKYLASKEIPMGVKCYTEYYRDNSKYKDYRDKAKGYYDAFSKSHTSLNILLCIMVAVLLSINFLSVYDKNISKDLIIHRLFITIVSCPAIFYIFNYCDRIMWSKGRVCSILTGLIGFSVIVGSYVLPNWWGILLGSEIIFFSICVYISMAHNAVKEAHTNLIKDFWIFFCIGFTVCVLGVIFLLFFNFIDKMSWQYYILRYSYYVLFSIYAVMSDVSHIKYSYICNKIGYSNMFDY